VAYRKKTAMRQQIATVALKQRILAPSALRKRGQEARLRKEHTVIAKLGESACGQGRKPLPLADQSKVMTAHALGACPWPRKTRFPSLRHREENSCV
jgi:hypothetical protein